MGGKCGVCWLAGRLACWLEDEGDEAHDLGVHNRRTIEAILFFIAEQHLVLGSSISGSMQQRRLMHVHA